MKRRSPGTIVRAAADLALERLWRIDSRGFVTQQEAGIDARDRVWYEPSAWMPLYLALRALEVTPSDSLLEYGAGKGRVLVLARLLPFARILGIEASAALAAQAEENQSRARRPRRRQTSSVVVADAADWTVPDDITVVYMNCPFTGEVFRSAIARLLESVDRRRRRVHLVYNNPVEHNYLLSTRRFRPVHARPAVWPPPPSWYLDRLRRPASAHGSWLERRVIITYDVLHQSVDRPWGDVARVGTWSGFRSVEGLLPPHHFGASLNAAAEGHSGCRATTSASPVRRSLQRAGTES